MDDMVVIDIESGNGDLRDYDSDVTMREESPMPSPEHIEYGHRRGRMDWPQAPVRDIVSRVPENSEELLSEYKKKTPVWEFPGYCNSVQQATKQTASLGWQYARGAYEAITGDADVDNDEDEEFEEVESEEIRKPRDEGGLERSKDGNKDRESDRGMKRPRDEQDEDEEFEELGNDNDMEEIRAQGMERPRDFSHWRYEPSGKSNNGSIFKSRFAFLNAQFGI
ncbi:hypothetical protein F4809DRAFT_173921 [Biscogniauxia mediterranea]|nr:hypothetical protein F4809DRAFT_173921 [Biscogniauxia mediterranea]